MDYKQMTAPCGLDCFNCQLYLADKDDKAKAALDKLAQLTGVAPEDLQCRGCRAHLGKIPVFKIYSLGDDYVCGVWRCITEKGHDFCHECGDFPCELLHPYADRADRLPHNTKVYNLCQIKKMGLEQWAKGPGAEARRIYFQNKWTLG